VSSQYLRFNARGAPKLRRSSLLEQLLARADRFTAVSDWRADAFRVIAPQSAFVPAVASAGLFAAFGAVQGAWVCMATPVHYVAELSSVRLSADGILPLSPAEGEALAADFNRVWHDSGVRLWASRSAELFCLFDKALTVWTSDPELVLGAYIEDHLPAGADAPRLQQLMSEIEMWLFGHAANAARSAAGVKPVNGLWLWGGGPPLASVPQVQGWSTGDDVFFKCFQGERSGSGVIVVSEAPGSDAWGQVESRWLAPAVAELRSGSLSHIDLSAGEQCFTVTAWGSRRFWRLRKPWWEWFA
jgi:hypothetical protein